MHAPKIAVEFLQFGWKHVGKSKGNSHSRNSKWLFVDGQHNMTKESSRTHQTMHVKNRKLGSFPPPLNHCLKPNPILIDVINRPSILSYNPTRCRLIAPYECLILPHPQPCLIHASVSLVRVQRGEVQGSEVEEHEVSGAEIVEVVKSREDAGDVVG